MPPSISELLSKVREPTKKDAEIVASETSNKTDTQEEITFDPLADDVEPPSKLSQTLSKAKEGAKKVASKAGEAADIGKAKLKSYFGKRTPEQIKAEQDAEDARQAQKGYEEEVEYQAELQRQPSKFEEQVSKAAKGTKTLIKKGITISKPVVKTIVKGVGKTVVAAGKTGVEVGKRMGKGMAKIDEEERATRNQPSQRSTFSPQRQQRMQPAREPVNKPAKPYNDDFFVSGGLGKRGNGGNSEFGIGEGKRSSPSKKKVTSGKPAKPYNDDYFVGGRKKTGGKKEDDDYFVSSKKPSQKPPKKGKGNTGRGFGLGF